MNVRQAEIAFGALCLFVGLVLALFSGFQNFDRSSGMSGGLAASLERAPLSVVREALPLQAGEGTPAASSPLSLIPSHPSAEGDAADVSSMEATGIVEQDIVIGPGDTFVKIFLSLGIGHTESYQIASKIATLFKPRELRPGQDLTVTYREEPDARGMQVQKVILQPNAARTIEVTRAEDGTLKAVEKKVALTSRYDRVSGTIKNGLFRDVSETGVPDNVIAKMIHNFSYSVDFQRDLKAGDKFDVVIERFYDEKTGKEHTAELMYAGLHVGGSTKKLFRFEHNGSVGYFNEKGESVRKALLRTPIDVSRARISSGYGMRRHPIQGYSKMHRGVDFAAPTGTPIMAAGDGTVKKAGPSGGYGNFVFIQHDGKHATAYGHMQRIAKNVKIGHKVRQGEVIGYVGATGNATGPHLHYEVHVNGQQVNPQKIGALPSAHLLGKDLKLFMKERDRIELRIAAIPSATRLAKLPGVKDSTGLA